MTQNKKRPVLPLATGDFESNKASLRAFLESQPEFTDYNFDGSALTMLLNLLSYDTYQKAFFLNQVGNEAFLKIGLRRESVVARANALGYVPRSVSSAYVKGTVSFTSASNQPSLIIPAGFSISANADGEAYTFQTIDDYVAHNQGNGTFAASDVAFYEGKKMTFRRTVDENDAGLTIPNLNADTTTLKVFVADADTPTTFISFYRSTDVTTQGSTSRAYYVEEVDGGFYRVYFGDDIISRAVGLGDVIRVDYLISSGADANQISNFAPAGEISGAITISLSIAEKSTGGADRESIESIKFNAPIARAGQGRAVTPEDYVPIVKSIFANAQEVRAVGGEELSPPQFKKIAIFVKPKFGLALTLAEKQELANLLKLYKVILTEPLILDPEYTFVNVKLDVYFSKLATALNEGQIKTLVTDAVAQYSDERLEKFDSVFSATQFTRFVLDLDQSIYNVVDSYELEKRVFVNVGVASEYNIKFDSTIDECTLRSSRIKYNGIDNCYMIDNCGILEIYQVSATGTDTLVQSAIGTVDKTTGTVKIPNLLIDGIAQTAEFYDEGQADYFLKFTARSDAHFVNNSKQFIVQIEGLEVNSYGTNGESI